MENKEKKIPLNFIDNHYRTFVEVWEMKQNVKENEIVYQRRKQIRVRCMRVI